MARLVVRVVGGIEIPVGRFEPGMSDISRFRSSTGLAILSGCTVDYFVLDYLLPS